MNLLPDTEQAAIAASAAAVLAKHAPLGAAASTDPQHDPVDDDLWGACAAQGFFGLGLAEGDGGVGYGPAEEALLFTEIGRLAVAGPFVGTVLAARLAAVAGLDDVRDDLLQGRARAGLAYRDGNDLVSFDGSAVELLLEVSPTRAVLTTVSGEPAQVECSDPAARLVRWDADLETVAEVVATAEDIWSRAAILLAAMLAGITASTRDQSAAYARTRLQFGTPIGAFQAVKHRCADSAIAADATAHVTSLAALTLAMGGPDTRRLAASALHVAADRAVLSAADNIQNHGGMGFTIEVTAHLLLKRAHTLGLSLGKPSARRAIVLDL